MPEVGGKQTGAGRREVLSGSGIMVTKSGNERPRTENDFYPTDPDTVRATLIRLAVDIPRDRIFMVLDPGAGTGVWGSVLRELYPRETYPLLYIIGVELDTEFTQPDSYNNWFTGNFLTDGAINLWAREVQHGGALGVDWVLGNPPYKLDTEFLAQAFRLVKTEGQARVDYLYRLGFAAAEERVFSFYGRGYAPSLMLIYNTRPSFLGTESKATYPGDYTTFSWRFEDGVADEDRRADHLVFKLCSTCGAIVFPNYRAARYYCPEHTQSPVELAPLDFGAYVHEGYRAYLDREARRAEKLATTALGEADEDRADEFTVKAARLRAELAQHMASKAA